MADKIPLRFHYNGSDVDGLAEYQAGETLPVANGGTGQSSFTDGQLLIGNTVGNTLAKAALTAGTGVTITNGAGSITISADPAALTVQDSTFNIYDNADNTKKVAFQVSGVTTGTTRTLTVPNQSGTIALTSDIVASGGFSEVLAYAGF